MQDYDLSAIFMRNWDVRDESGTDKDGKGCEWEKDWEDVQRVCRALDVPCKMVRCRSDKINLKEAHQVQVDLSKEYWNRVFDPALRIWQQGDTPNPDVWCNKYALLLVLLLCLMFLQGDQVWGTT